jgi:phospholipid N-methyltransferase
MMVRDIGLENASAVVEIGPGTGAVTNMILETIPDSAEFIAIEIDPGLHAIFKERFPDVKSHNECASNIVSILEKENVRELDAVLSGLPWASFPEELQIKLMDAVCEALEPKKGVFATFAYLQGTLLPAGRRFKRTLESRFSKVEKSPIVWNNIPPAFVYKCSL